MAKKKTAKKKKEELELIEKPVEKTEALRKLTEEEMLKIENHNLKVQALTMAQEAIRQKKNSMNLQLDKQLMEKAEELRMAQDKRKSYNKYIKEELGLESETWGYDPLTGEVKS